MDNRLFYIAFKDEGPEIHKHYFQWKSMRRIGSLSYLNIYIYILLGLNSQGLNYKQLFKKCVLLLFLWLLS